MEEEMKELSSLTAGVVVSDGELPELTDDEQGESQDSTEVAKSEEKSVSSAPSELLPSPTPEMCAVESTLPSSSKQPETKSVKMVAEVAEVRVACVRPFAWLEGKATPSSSTSKAFDETREETIDVDMTSGSAERELYNLLSPERRPSPFASRSTTPERPLSPALLVSTSPETSTTPIPPPMPQDPLYQSGKPTKPLKTRDWSQSGPHLPTPADNSPQSEGEASTGVQPPASLTSNSGELSMATTSSAPSTSTPTPVGFTNGQLEVLGEESMDIEDPSERSGAAVQPQPHVHVSIPWVPLEKQQGDVRFSFKRPPASTSGTPAGYLQDERRRQAQEQREGSKKNKKKSRGIDFSGDNLFSPLHNNSPYEKREIPSTSGTIPKKFPSKTSSRGSSDGCVNSHRPSRRKDESQQMGRGGYPESEEYLRQRALDSRKKPGSTESPTKGTQFIQDYYQHAIAQGQKLPSVPVSKKLSVPLTNPAPKPEDKTPAALGFFPYHRDNSWTPPERDPPSKGKSSSAQASTSRVFTPAPTPQCSSTSASVRPAQTVRPAAGQGASQPPRRVSGVAAQNTWGDLSWPTQDVRAPPPPPLMQQQVVPPPGFAQYWEFDNYLQVQVQRGVYHQMEGMHQYQQRQYGSGPSVLPAQQTFPANSPARLQGNSVQQNPARRDLQAPLQLTPSPENRARFPWMDSKGNRLSGTFLRGLAPVPFDPNLDVMPYICFNCRYVTHAKSKCTEPLYQGDYCRNCGRSGTVVSKCERCALAYKAYLLAQAQAAAARGQAPSLPVCPSTATSSCEAPQQDQVSASTSSSPAKTKTPPAEHHKQRRGGVKRKQRIQAKKDLEAQQQAGEQDPTVARLRDAARQEHQEASVSGRREVVDQRRTPPIQQQEAVDVAGTTNEPSPMSASLRENWDRLVVLAHVADPDNPTPTEYVRMMRLLRHEANSFDGPSQAP